MEHPSLTPSVIQQLPPAVDFSEHDQSNKEVEPSEDREFLLGPPEPKRKRPNTAHVVTTLHPVSELTQKYQGAMFQCKGECVLCIRIYHTLSILCLCISQLLTFS